MATTTIKVGGMTCGACTSAVESGFEGVEGVGAVSVSLIMERAVIQHNPEKIPAERIVGIIEDCGFDAELLSTDLTAPTTENKQKSQDSGDATASTGLYTTTLSVGGMTCGACTSAIEETFKDAAGVHSFSVSLITERAVAVYDPKVLSPESIVDMIEGAGFDASIIETKAVLPTSNDASDGKRRKSKALISTFGIEGMTCGACTSAVESTFEGVEGVLQFNISLLAERAVITHAPAKISAEQIAEMINGAGFEATIISSVDNTAQTSSSSATIYLKIYGLTDSNSASELEKTLQSQSGVSAATINFSTSRCTVTYKPQSIGLRAIVEVVEKAGFNALVADADDNNAQLESLAKTKEIQEWRTAFRTSLFFAIPVLLISMIFPMWLKFLDFGSIKLVRGLWLGDVVCLALTIPVQFGIGRRFYKSAYKSIRHGSPTMDVLFVLGTTAAFVFSVCAMLVSFLIPPYTRPATVFDTSTMLFTFISLGRYLENSAKGQTSKALSRLMSLAPSSAIIYADPILAVKAAEDWEKGEKGTESMITAEERVVPTELIEIGDVVIIKPGDKIPADGIVTRGESYIDESMVTGEPLPILKKKGSSLMTGTVNSAGRLDFRVTRAGRDTQLSQIVRLVQEAQTSRAPIQRMADVVAGKFVPVIITLGLATFVSWMILSHVLPHPPAVFLDNESGGKFMVCMKLCISVIVFACPCALGLSTPTAVMVGTGVGAEQGILVKGGAALETATKITHVVLDKTGTLTVGKMCVNQADIKGNWDADASTTRLWWTLIGLAEMSSEHPIAKAIVLAAKEHLGIGPDGALDGSIGDFEAVVGKGIAATAEAAAAPNRRRYRVLIGNAAYLRSQGVNLPFSADVNEATTPIAGEFATASETSIDSAGITTIHTAVDTVYTGRILLSDTLRPSARAMVRALQRLKISCSIVTGDAEAPALIVAKQVGIPASNVHAGSTPADKQRIIEELQVPRAAGGPGQVVAMVGDGINDSPALATASIGIALASGTDVAMEAADIVLMLSGETDLLAIPASLHLARSIFRRIKMNLLWACGYNVIGLPFAMGFFLPWGLHLHPMAAGAAMAMSSVSVVTSSLALKWWKRPKWMSVGVLDPEMAAQMRSGSSGRRMQELEVEGGKRPGVWSSLQTLVTLRFTRWRSEREGGAYAPLRNESEV